MRTGGFFYDGEAILMAGAIFIATVCAESVFLKNTNVDSVAVFWLISVEIVGFSIGMAAWDPTYGHAYLAAFLISFAAIVGAPIVHFWAAILVFSLAAPATMRLVYRSRRFTDRHRSFRR